MNKFGILIKYWLLPVWVALFWGMSVQGQTPKPKLLQTYLRLADEYWQYDQYAEAARYYLKVTEINPNHLYATYQVAECNRNLFRYIAAEAGYGKVYYEDTKTYPKALFYYALMQKLNGKYAYAIQNFEKFLNESNSADLQQWPDKNDWIARATVEKDGCHFALLREKFAQRDFGFALLEKPASTPANDYAPVIFENDTSLLITSGRMLDSGRVADTRLGEGFSNFYLFQKQGSQWENVQEQDLLKNVNTKWSEGSGCFNRDKTKFYYTNCSEPNASCKIYVTTLHDGKWSKPTKLNQNINTPEADARHPALSVTGDTLFFASNRTGGFGKNDIWMSVKASGDNWSPAINLGNKINTAINELSPFVNTEEGKFIFASEGHLGLGGLDIFVINGSLSSEFEVMNLGPPFNSNRDDCFFVMGSTKGYLASNRTEGPGNFDLYTFDNFSRNTIIAGINQQTQQQTTDFYYLQEFSLEYLSDADKLSLERVASRKEAGKVYRQEMPLTEDDLDFYQRLSQEERDRLERLVAFNIERKGGEEIIREEDQAYYQELPLEERARVRRFAAAYRNAMLNKKKLTLDQEDEFYYQKLNSEGRRTLDRVVASKFSELEENGDSSMFLAENSFYYEKLPAAIKLPIRRDSVSQRHMMGVDSLRGEDDSYNYMKLNAEEVDRLSKSNSMYTASNKNNEENTFGEEDDFNYKKLSTADKDRIDRMAAVRKSARSAGTDEKFSEEDQFYYVSLSSEERSQLDRLISYYLAREMASSDLSVLDEEQYSYQKISGTEKHRLENKALNRKGHILPMSDTYWDEEGRSSTTLAELNTFQMGAYNSFTVRGRLYNTATKQPAAGLTIPLTNERGEVIKTTTTNPDGSFMYVNLSLKDSYRVLLQTPATKVTDPSHFYVEDLEIIAYNGDANNIKFEPVFFGFNEYQAGTETKKTLNALIAYYKLHPQIQIELDAFTDNVGTDEYNLQLSQRRGEVVQKYLLKHGVSPGALVMNARGKRTPGTAVGKRNGKASDRRVDLIIKGAADAFEPTTDIYIISPQTNLKRIAEKFGMPVEELKQMNNIVTDQVESYRPLKIKRR